MNLFQKLSNTITKLRADHLLTRAHDLMNTSKILEEEALTLRAKSRQLHIEANAMLRKMLVDDSRREALKKATAPYKIDAGR